MDATQFLQTIAEGVKSDPARTVRLATIDPAYSTGDPKVTFDGETAVSGKTYKCVGYTPVASQRVVLLPVGNTSYVIMGAVGSTDSTLPARLETMNQLGAGVDPTTLTDNGFYAGYNWTGTVPSTGLATVLVERYSPDWINQTFTIPGAVPRRFVRSWYSGTTWGPWVEQENRLWTGPNLPVFRVVHGASFNMSGAQYITPLAFNTVKVNQGSHWDTSTKKFTAPVAGVYEFNLTICNSGNTGGPEAGIYKNGSLHEFLVLAYTYYNQPSGQTYVTLAQGDTIHPVLRNNNGTTVAVDGTRSSFSGRLVSLA